MGGVNPNEAYKKNRLLALINFYLGDRWEI